MPTHYQGTNQETRALNAYIKLMRATDSVQSQLDLALYEYGLTENQFGILEVLYHLGPMHQRELGQKLFTSKGNITHVLENLTRGQLVKRERNATDRRQIMVRLTASGRKTVERVLPQQVTQIVALFAALSPTEQDALGALSKKLGLSIKGSQTGTP
jgi:MarR family transcriptional regulator, 2-MHQ and catechol-resistance regulon repressor